MSKEVVIYWEDMLKESEAERNRLWIELALAKERVGKLELEVEFLQDEIRELKKMKGKK